MIELEARLLAVLELLEAPQAYVPEELRGIGLAAMRWGLIGFDDAWTLTDEGRRELVRLRELRDRPPRAPKAQAQAPAGSSFWDRVALAW